MRATATDFKEAWPFGEDHRHEVLDPETEKVMLTELGALLESIAQAAGIKLERYSIKSVDDALQQGRPEQSAPPITLHTSWKRIRAIRNELIERNLRLVIHASQSYRSHGCTFADLVQQGNMGLVKAADRFEPHRGRRFSTYASHWIHNEIGQLIRDTASLVRRPRHIIDQLNTLHRNKHALTQALQRSPNCTELAEHCELTAEKTRHLLALSQHPVAVESWENPGDGGTVIESELVDHHQVAELIGEHIDTHDIEHWMTLTLESQERYILERRFGFTGDKPDSLDTLAAVFGWSREKTRRRQNDALKKLRVAMGDTQHRQCQPERQSGTPCPR